MDKHIEALIRSKDMQIQRLRALLDRANSETRPRPDQNVRQVVDDSTVKHKSSAEAPEKDLKGGKEDSTLISIVEQYRKEREKEQNKKL